MTTIEKIKTLFRESKFENVLDLLEKLSEKDRPEGVIIKSKILMKQGDINGALALLDSEILSPDIRNDNILFLKCLIQKSSSLWYTGNYEEALSEIKQAEIILSNLNKYDKSKVVEDSADLFYTKGKIFLSQGKLNLALINQTASLQIREIYDDEKSVASNLNIIGVIFIHQGDIKSAILNLERSLSIYESLNEVDEALYLLNNLGGVYHTIGELNKAMTYLNKGLKLIGNKNAPLKSKLLNNIGNVYSVKGNYKEAISFYEESLELKKEISNEHSLGFSYFNIARIHRAEGNYSVALDYYKTSLEIFQKIGNNIESSNVLVEMISFYSLIDSTKVVAKYFKDLSKYNTTSQIPIIKLYHEYASALILMKRNLLPYTIRANHMFSMIVTNKILNFEISMLSIINLIEIKFNTYKIFKTEGTLNNIRQLTNKLHEIAHDHNSLTILVNSLILKAKLQALLTNFASAQNFLNQADLIVEEKGLFGFSKKITHLQSKIAEHKYVGLKLNEKRVTSESLLDDIEFFDFYGQLEEMIKTYV